MTEQAQQVSTSYIDSATSIFASYKKLGERALEQMNDQEFFSKIDSESNSAAIIVKHIAGNQRSRWKDFLISDGEKEDRKRDGEFEIEIGIEDRMILMEYWENGWAILFEALKTINSENFETIVEIRCEPHTIIEAVNRQIGHYAYHVGQIVFIAKHLKSEDWENLSIARNRSSQFTEYVAGKIESNSLEPTQLETALAFSEELKNKEKGS